MNRIVTLLLALASLALPQIAQAQAEKLLITRIFSGPTPAELIAIYNPGTATVDLSHYFVSDADTYYQVVSSMAPAASDFIAQFPAGATIAPGETQYIAVGGAECFRTACSTTGAFAGYGFYPTYEILSSTAANNAASVPDMRAPFMGAIGSTHGLTNGSELAMLFYWDGVTSIVTDVDYVFYFGTGTPATPVNKTGVVGYQPDTTDAPSHHAPMGTTGVTGTCRVSPYTESSMVLTGGNGIGGRDETSEPTMTTFMVCDATAVTMPSLIDAGTSLDAGLDAGSDAGTDAGVDGGMDAGSDAGMDAAASTIDSGIDAGEDAASATDAGTDAAVLVMLDMGVAHDAGHDASAAADASARDAASGHDAGTTTPRTSNNCGCTAAGAGSSSGSWLALLALGALIRRRVRR